MSELFQAICSKLGVQKYGALPNPPNLTDHVSRADALNLKERLSKVFRRGVGRHHTFHTVCNEGYALQSYNWLPITLWERSS